MFGQAALKDIVKTCGRRHNEKQIKDCRIILNNSENFSSFDACDYWRCTLEKFHWKDMTDDNSVE